MGLVNYFDRLFVHESIMALWREVGRWDPVPEGEECVGVYRTVLYCSLCRKPTTSPVGGKEGGWGLQTGPVL